MSLKIGTRIGPYEITSPIGAGGMGEVYRAKDSRLDREVALKVLPPEFASNPERRRRFEREAKAIAALNHPNIVTIHSVEEVDGIHFITMELVTGRPLSAFIRRKGLALEKVLELTAAISEAVACAHDRGITHRDLKPDNVMVDDEGRVKVLDFGLAKLHSEESGVAEGSQVPTATVPGRVLGTVAYMSPEQAQGLRSDPRSDVFSLGIMLYEMVTGQRPFEGETPLETLTSIVGASPTPIDSLRPGLSPAIMGIIDRCLAKDPRDRFQSAAGLRRELATFKRELESGHLTGPGTSKSVSHGWSKRRVAFGSALISLLIVVSVVVWLTNRAIPRILSLIPRHYRPLRPKGR